ncbi:hypothetical protein D3C87_1462520 [compost metagenome]
MGRIAENPRARIQLHLFYIPGKPGVPDHAGLLFQSSIFRNMLFAETVRVHCVRIDPAGLSLSFLEGRHKLHGIPFGVLRTKNPAKT